MSVKFGVLITDKVRGSKWLQEDGHPWRGPKKEAEFLAAERNRVYGSMYSVEPFREVASFWKELYEETGGQIEDHRPLSKSRKDLREWAEAILFSEVPPSEWNRHNLDDVVDHLLTII